MSSVLSHLAQSGLPLVHHAPDGVTLLDVDSGAPIGEGPPVPDVRAWDADGASLPARLPEQLLGMIRDSQTRPGDVPVLGWPVGLARSDVPTLVTGPVDDHPSPWTGCCRTTALLSGPSTVVLGHAGRILGLVDPPGGPTASSWVGGEAGPGAAARRGGAARRTGGGSAAWSARVLERRGGTTDAPAGLGSERHPPLEPAPGAYVLDREPAPERVSSGPSGRRP